MSDSLSQISWRHFNSRPSARDDGAVLFPAHSHPISIHAPPRGATAERRLLIGLAHISIHAPPRGATSYRKAQPAVRKFQFTPLREGRRSIAGTDGVYDIFQFTPLREGRPWRNPVDTRRTRISIHAPPRGATCHALRNAVFFAQFQFPPLREGRREPSAVAVHRHLFQFPPLREGRLRGCAFSAQRQISIPAPPRGATRRASRLPAARRFQFPPLREGRLDATGKALGLPDISIPAPPRGATAACY